jgi:hypothetical protein
VRVQRLGAGGDRVQPFLDPENPRFRILMFQNGGGGQVVWGAQTDRIGDYFGGSVQVPCGWIMRCGLHLLGYDRKLNGWMIIGSSNRYSWWVFSRVPGLSSTAAVDVQTRIKALGLQGEFKTNHGVMPPLPELLPMIPESLPPVPGIPQTSR